MGENSHDRKRSCLPTRRTRYSHARTLSHTATRVRVCAVDSAVAVLNCIHQQQAGLLFLSSHSICFISEQLFAHIPFTETLYIASDTSTLSLTAYQQEVSTTFSEIAHFRFSTHCTRARARAQCLKYAQLCKDDCTHASSNSHGALHGRHSTRFAFAFAFAFALCANLQTTASVRRAEHRARLSERKCNSCSGSRFGFSSFAETAALLNHRHFIRPS